MLSHQHQTLEARLTLLERQNRRQRRALLAVPLVAVLLGAAAGEVADWKGKSVTAERFILVDSDGKEQGAWFVHQGDPVLELYNKDHSLILNAGKSPENGVGFVQFFDAKGEFKGGVGGNALE